MYIKNKFLKKLKKLLTFNAATCIIVVVARR
nr:MAG TPA: hypothetical protein [Caudoviricetes sp.]